MLHHTTPSPVSRVGSSIGSSYTRVSSAANEDPSITERDSIIDQELPHSNLPLQNEASEVSSWPQKCQSQSQRIGNAQRRAKPLSTWTRLCSRVDSAWICELLACLFSLGCLVGVIIVLRRFDGQPRPDWSFDLSINTWLAILATGLKVSMIYATSEALSQLKWIWFIQPHQLSDFAYFDYASRGPWGSLLLCLTWKMHSLAKFGALIILAALAVDPFSQALITYEICTRVAPSEIASLPRIEAFYWPTYGLRGSTKKINLMHDIMSNIVNLESATLPSVLPTCSTTSCSFNASRGFYQTLAIDHYCRDITEQIVPIPFIKNDKNSFQLYTLPVNSSILPPDQREMTMEVTYRGGYSFMAFPDASNQTANNASIASLKMLLLNNTMDPFPKDLFVSFKRGPGGFKPDDFTEDVMAVECHFRPVVRTMNTFVDQGRVRSTLVNTDLSRTHDRYVWQRDLRSAVGEDHKTTEQLIKENRGEFDLDNRYIHIPPEVVTNGVWTPCKNVTTWTPEYSLGMAEMSDYYEVSLNDTAFNATMSRLVFYKPECVFMLRDYAARELANALIGVFGPVDSQTTKYNFKNRSIYASPDQTVRWVYQESGTSLHLDSLWNYGNVSFGDVDHYAKRIADSMTATMIREGDPENTGNAFAAGTAMATMTCAYVRWWWISLPALLVTLAWVFLGSVILYSRQQSRKSAWPGLLKSSPLGLIFMRPSNDPAPSYAGPLAPTSLEDESKGWYTVLQRR